ncbi:MAG: hypothetical protein QOE31_977 [Solirubrobacteraceae bacterium]|jgi:DNA-binding SARP family transcriptional activator|nr:hypothetical protein [Solirubrobacteraceae bacterium]
MTVIPPDQPAPSADALLHRLPYGVVALDSEGNVLSANAAAHDLIPGLATAAVRTCHELFSCRPAGGPCERRCLVARAALSSKPAPEIRIDTTGGTFPGALWVTAAPLGNAEGTILHLRPGSRSDRRRRSEERWQTGPELRIHTFGRTHVEALEDSVGSDWLSQRPGQILKYLVCERERVVMVDEIIESIWPDGGPRSVSNARFAIHRLRMKLEPRRTPHDMSTFIVSRRGGGYALDRERIWIDADEFERAIVQGRAAMRSLDPNGAGEHLERAMRFYRGTFLADEPYAHWAVDERHRLAGLATYALRVLTALARERDDNDDALRHLQRLAELEPLDSTVHREYIQALLGAGMRSQAKRRYENFAHRIWRELGEEPDFDLPSLSSKPAVPDPP